MTIKKYPITPKNSDSLNSKELSNKAYPNYDQYMHIPGQHDTSKWLKAAKDIFYKEKNGTDRANAVRQATTGWNPMETFDFLNWLKFYEEGSHMKYKTAANWYENGDYFLHIKPDPEKKVDPQVSGKDFNNALDDVSNEMSLAEKKQIIEKQRAKIIGRLDSAEKLLRSQDGQFFAGKELESLMESIYALKKKVQLVNKLSSSTRLYEDMIVREGNSLNRKGFIKAANILYSVAQVPQATPPAPPMEGSGSAGGLPSMGPGMPQNPPESAPNDPPELTEVSKGISDFLKGTETSNLTDKEDLTENDELEVNDELEIDDKLEVSDEDDLVIKEAQVPPPIDEPMTNSPAPAQKNIRQPFTPVKEDSDIAAPTKTLKEEDLEVSENDIENPSELTSNFDSKLDQLFAGITVNDVIIELESLSKIFKTREIPRRLSKADMMLDSLGLASFFPSLSEAQNKSLEANNYISSRVDDILSKLRGSLSSKEIDLEGNEGSVDRPELSGIKNKLKTDEEKEKTRKQMRKDQEASEMINKNKETPEIEVAEDLGAPPPAGPAGAPPATKPIV